MMNKLRDNQHGDTIVEVLIAIAVVGLILAGAYVTTNRNLQTQETAQERSVALQVAQTQIEELRSYVYSNGDTLPNQASYCMENSTTVNTLTSDCKFDKTGGWSQNPAQPYYVSTITNTASSEKQVKVLISWASIISSSQQQLEVDYRLE